VSAEGINQYFHFGILDGQNYTPESPLLLIFFIFSSWRLPTAPEEAKLTPAGARMN
jgi:hypothetical protein